MDPEFSEDEFDRLLRDEVVPDAILRAADLLETEALGIFPQITKQTIEADEYDIMLADDISSDILLACDEAERVASLSEMLLQGKGDDPQSTLVVSPRLRGSALKRSRSPSIPPTSSAPPSIPLRDITNQTRRFNDKKFVVLGSPISISSDESSDEGSRDSCSTPATSQIASSSVRGSSTATNSRASVSLHRPLDNMNASSKLVYDCLAARPRFYLPANAVKTAPNPAPGPSRPTLKRKFHADSLEEPRPPKKAKPINHLALFFARYPRFRYDPHAPVSAQYDALCRLYRFSGCKLEHAAAKSERDVAYAGYQRAMALSFGASFGTDVNDLDSLQSLARVLQIDPIPQRVWACQQAIRAVHVNLVDLVDWGNSKGQSPPPRIFETLDDLRVYTQKTRKFFPQGQAKNTLLQFLLRHVL